MAILPTQILNCDTSSSVLLDLLISCNPSNCSKVDFTPLMLLSQLSLTFFQTQKEMPLFIAQLYDYLMQALA